MSDPAPPMTTVRHVVMFRLRDAGLEQKQAAAARIRAVLEPLPGLIPGLLDLEVGVDLGQVGGHWDAVLVSHHTDVDALAGYQTHPDHVAAARTVATLVVETATVDHPVGPLTAGGGRR